MNFLRSLVAAVAFFASCSALSSDQWYLGVTQGFYSVGEGDHWNGEIDIGQAGLKWNQIEQYFLEMKIIKKVFLVNGTKD